MLARNLTTSHLAALTAAVLLLTMPHVRADEPQIVEFQHVIVDDDNPRDPHCKAAGDITGDGHHDLLAAGASDGGLYWYRYPDWTKHRIAAGSFTTDMAVGDVDGSGHLDVVIPGGRGLMWYRNPMADGGDPATDPWRPHNIGPAGANMHDVRLADLNGNGRLDAVTRDQSGFGSRTGNRIHLWVQHAPDQWEHRSFPCPHGEGIELADLTGNGLPDVVIGARWYENPGDVLQGEWAEHRYIDDETFDQGWTDGDVCVAVGDLNGNGRLDIALSPAEGSGRLSWFEAPADPRQPAWTEHPIVEHADHVHALAIGDVNADGRLDVIAAKMHQASEPQEVAVFYNRGAGRGFNKQVLATRGSHNIVVFPWPGTDALAVFGANWNDNSPTGGALELWAPAVR